MFSDSASNEIWGTKFGVITPATNMVFESELHKMTIPKVHLFVARVLIERLNWHAEDGLQHFVEGVYKRLPCAIEQISQIRPHAIILGVSIANFWGGLKGNEQLKENVLNETGKQLITPVDGLCQAVKVLKVKNIGVLTPYPPEARERVSCFFKDLDVNVVTQIGMNCSSPYKIAEIDEKVIMSQLEKLSLSNVDTLIQLGTDLRCAKLAAHAERILGIPVIAINTATWWHSLRCMGVNDKVEGWGKLLEIH